MTTILRAFSSITLLIICSIYLPQVIYSQDEIHFEVGPHRSAKGLTFTFLDGRVKKVEMVTSLDKFKSVHKLNKVTKEYWEIDFDGKMGSIILKPQLIKYRFLVDGKYILDPGNHNYITDGLGNSFSTYKLEQYINYKPISPKIHDNGFVSFFYKNNNAKSVYLMGTFNNFSPRLTKLEKGKDGFWFVKIPMAKGIHYYFFNVDGKKIPDIHPNIRTTPTGNKLSMIEIK